MMYVVVLYRQERGIVRRWFSVVMLVSVNPPEGVLMYREREPASEGETEERSGFEILR